MEEAPAESYFVHTSFAHGVPIYTRRSTMQRWRAMLPAYPPPPSSPSLDPEEEESTSSGEEGGFQGPLSIRDVSTAGTQQQGKRGRGAASSEAAILRLREVTPAAYCSDSDCCAICLEDFVDPAADDDPLPARRGIRAMPSCSHAFHEHCILKWLRLNAVCPVCRRQLPLSLSTEEEEDDEEEEAQWRSIRRGYDRWLSLVANHANQGQREREAGQGLTT